MSPILAEFIGTTLLMFLGNGVVANVLLKDTKGNGSGWLVITTAWGLAVFVGVVIAGPYSGAHLNPAVTLGLAVAEKFVWANVIPFILAQFGGSMTGSLLVWLMYKDHYDRTSDKDLVRATFCTSPAIHNRFSNLLSEVLGSFVLIFVIFYFTSAEISDKKTPIGLGSVGAIPVAFLVWVIGLSLGGTTGYAINPARDLGPRLIHAILPLKHKGGSDWRYSWIPVLGPILGGILAAAVYLIVKE